MVTSNNILCACIVDVIAENDQISGKLLSFLTIFMREGHAPSSSNRPLHSVLIIIYYIFHNVEEERMELPSGEDEQLLTCSTNVEGI